METVRAFLERTSRDPGEEIATVAHLGRSCTVQAAAIAAAMAGCRPEHFPVVLAAIQSMQPSIATGLLQSTTGQCQLVIVNGAQSANTAPKGALWPLPITRLRKRRKKWMNSSTVSKGPKLSCRLFDQKRHKATAMKA